MMRMIATLDILNIVVVLARIMVALPRINSSPWNRFL
jgi:hypothetical protein